MSDGKKAMYEDMEEEYYRKRKQKLAEMNPDDLLRIFESIKNSMSYLQTSNIALTWGQHSRIRDVREQLEKLP